MQCPENSTYGHVPSPENDRHLRRSFFSNENKECNHSANENQDPSAPTNYGLLQLSSKTKDLMDFKDGSSDSDSSGVLNNEDCSFHYPPLMPPKSHQSGRLLQDKQSSSSRG
nr:homeobox-leucine zipper protein ATHB-6-like [Ipomoea trifida]